MARRVELKRTVAELLSADNPREMLPRLSGFSQRLLLTTLMVNLNSSDQERAVRAAELIGLLVKSWIDDQGEAGRQQGREAMRRLVWSLNEESGSIGWGAPRAMAQIMSHDRLLAQEFVNLLVSYITDGHNFLEYEPLQRSVLWGLGHMAQTQPDLIDSLSLASTVNPLLGSPDAEVRGAAAFVLGRLAPVEGAEGLSRLIDDREEVSIPLPEGLVKTSVGRLAREALDRLESSSAGQ